jgi:uncharacterized membrane protein YdjX (TVP38/TMEM64 family)
MVKNSLALITIFCIVTTGIGLFFLGGIEPEMIQNFLNRLGIWAPIIYVLLYTIGTILLLPSTPLNLSGGALFGIWWGTFWTALAAIIAAIVSFYYGRTIGRDWVQSKFGDRIKTLDAEIQQGGVFYLFAIRLLPIIPYGIVNFVAGLTSITFKDYVIGTVLGTVPGILPFVMIGAGIQAISQGDLLPLMIAFALVGILVFGATWYRRHRQSPVADLAKAEQKYILEKQKATERDRLS